MNIKERLKEYGILALICSVLILLISILVIGYFTILYFVTPEECREAPTWLLFIQEGIHGLLILIGTICALCLGGFIGELISTFTQKSKLPKINLGEKTKNYLHKIADTILYPIDKVFTFLAWLTGPLHRFLNKYNYIIFITIVIIMVISIVVTLIFEVFKAYYCL